MRWPNGRVPYVISSDFGKLHEFLKTSKHFFFKPSFLSTKEQYEWLMMGKIGHSHSKVSKIHFILMYPPVDFRERSVIMEAIADYAKYT